MKRPLRRTVLACSVPCVLLLGLGLVLGTATEAQAQKRNLASPIPPFGATTKGGPVLPPPAGTPVPPSIQTILLGQSGIGYNAIETPGGTIAPVYSVRAPKAGTTGVVFLQSGGTVTAYAADPWQKLWTREYGTGELTGGLDFNRDGWPDLVMVRTQKTPYTWGNQPVLQSWLDFFDGRTGASYRRVTPPLRDRLWDFRVADATDLSKVYPTRQWAVGSVLAGDYRTSTIAIEPVYAETGQMLTFDPRADAFRGYDYIFPSTNRYDETYSAAALNPRKRNRSYMDDSHIANGLVVNYRGHDRLIFFTTGRVVQYAVAPLGERQLLADYPFVPGRRTNTALRNYGLVQLDPAAPYMVLVGGTGAYTMAKDLRAGKVQEDPYGGIERHVTIYNYEKNQLDDRFFSYAHDAGDAYKYDGRVVYPCHALITPSAAAPSRLAYNVYRRGRWHFHVSLHGGTQDQRVIKDLFVWDIRDLDMNGTQEIIASPARYPTDPDVPGYYFVKRETWIMTWDERARDLKLLKKYAGVTPHLVPTFRMDGDHATSQEALYPVLTTVQNGRLKIVCEDAAGKVRFVNY